MVVGGQRLARTESAACYSTPRTRRHSRTSRGRTAAMGARAFATAAQCPAGCVTTTTAASAGAAATAAGAGAGAATLEPLTDSGVLCTRPALLLTA